MSWSYFQNEKTKKGILREKFVYYKTKILPVEIKKKSF